MSIERRVKSFRSNTFFPQLVGNSDIPQFNYIVVNVISAFCTHVKAQILQRLKFIYM